MAREHIRELDVPPPTMGQALFKLNATEQAQTNTFVVSVASNPVGGGVNVILQGAYVHARVATTAKNVKQGDRAIVTKRGGQWTVVEVETWHEPPTLPPPPSTGTLPNATTTTTTAIPTVNSTSLNTFADPNPFDNYKTWANLARSNYSDMINVVNSMRLAVNSLRTQVTNARTTINNNASASNSLKTGVQESVDALTPITDALKNDRIAK